MNIYAESVKDIRSGDELSGGIKKMFLLLFFVIFAILAIRISGLSEYLKNADEFAGKIRGLGAYGPIIFIAISAVLIACGVPRLVFCPIAGLAFGFIPGLVYGTVGTLMAYYAFFAAFRLGGREFARKIWEKKKFQKAEEIIKKGGIQSVILVRQMPLHGMAINILLSLSPVKNHDFIIGTAIGILPQAIPLTLLGDGRDGGTLFKITACISIALIAGAVIWLSKKGFFKQSKEGGGTKK